tara:strand:+ start:659 stop:808 length:150 start_codon:yes stop_codon:yes gene_type:complete
MFNLFENLGILKASNGRISCYRISIGKTLKAAKVIATIHFHPGVRGIVC